MLISASEPVYNLKFGSAQTLHNRDPPSWCASKEELQINSMNYDKRTNLYNAFNEFLVTERTFTQDLKFLIQKFSESDGQQLTKYGRAITELQAILKALYSFHQTLLNETEEKMSSWSAVDSNESLVVSICEMLLCSVHNAIQQYRTFVQQSPIYIAVIDELRRTDKSFAKKVWEESLSYLPIQWLLLNAVFHMTVWQNILGRVIAGLLEEDNNPLHNKPLSSCNVAMDKIAMFNSETLSTRAGFTNFIKLMEIESELNGVDNLIQPKRSAKPKLERYKVNFLQKATKQMSLTQTHEKFIREGYLNQWDNNQMIGHMFIAFNDVLLYASLPHEDDNFNVHGVIPLRGARVYDGETYYTLTDSKSSLIIWTPKKTSILSANSTYAKEVWKDDLQKLIKAANDTKIDDLPQAICAKIYGPKDSSENSVQSFNLERNTFKSSETINQPITKERSKTSTLRLCWYRQTTIGADAFLKIAANQISGYLLRKFRTSVGWQCLWVVLANYTLFFYRKHTEDVPLASLNLVDYQVSLPLVSDGINKNYVFKLFYRKHSYFFRAENAYQFTRWTNGIRIAAQNFPSNFLPTDLMAHKA